MNNLLLAITCVTVFLPSWSFGEDELSTRCLNSNTASGSQLLCSSSSSNISPDATRSPSFIPVPSNNFIYSCARDGLWRRTLVGKNATRTGICYKGTVIATRRCGSGGIWDEADRVKTSEFSLTLDKIRDLLEQGLKNLLDQLFQPMEDISLEQSAFLLKTMVDSQSRANVSITDCLVKNILNSSVAIVSKIRSKYSSLHSDSRRLIGSRLIYILDNFGLNLTEPPNETIGVEDSILLRVSEFNDPVTTDIYGIVSGKNYILLPSEILGEEIGPGYPARIASFLYRNLSDLLPPRDNNTSIISPVISSTVHCQSCPTYHELTHNVTVQLQVEDLSAATTGSISCAFFKFEFVEDSLPTGDWSTEGCSTIVDGDIVTCSCNHLTHFAILLSPGVNVC